MGVVDVLWCIFIISAFLTLTYGLLLGILIFPRAQRHAIYLHRCRMTYGRDTSVPEHWGFMRNQVTPFTINTSDHEILQAWHILPHQIYHDHQQRLLQDPTGADITSSYGFELLRQDPQAVTVAYFHGAGGTLGSGYRPASYEAMSGASRRVHVVAVDYRGFGKSTGFPTESGLLLDAIAVIRWITEVAGVPHSRIVVFGHSIGTAVSLSLQKHFALQDVPIVFAALILVAPFLDAETLASTYKINGIVPILSPLSCFPRLLSFFQKLIVDKMSNSESLARFIRAHEATCAELPYSITIIHAKDDNIVNWSHSETLFHEAVNAVSNSTTPGRLRIYDEQGNRVRELNSKRGIIRQEILRNGLHDAIISHPVLGSALQRVTNGLP